MKTQSILNIFAKSDLQVLKEQSEIYDHFSGEKKLSTPKYYVENNGYVLSWFDQEGETVCAKIRRINDHDDSQSDYFAGFFINTLKEIKRYLLNK